MDQTNLKTGRVLYLGLTSDHVFPQKPNLSRETVRSRHDLDLEKDSEPEAFMFSDPLLSKRNTNTAG